MKKYWYLAFLMCFTLMALPSCNDDDKDEIEIDWEWKQENDEFFEKIEKDPSFKEIKSPGNNGSIYYKVIKEGDGSDPRPIYYNSTIKAYYTGWLINKSGEDYFDSRENPYQNVAQFTLNNVIEGWAIACANMKVGDRWEVWVPYSLGYGVGGSGTIPGCSTLHFEIEITDIVKQ